MRNAVDAVIDRHLEDLMLAWARRQWPVLRLVPARWIRPAVTPTAVRLRRSISRGVLAFAVPLAILLALLTLTP